MDRTLLLPPSANPEIRLRERITRVNETLRTEQQISGGRSRVQYLTLDAPWRAYAGGTGNDVWGQPRVVRQASDVVHLEGLIDKAGGNWVVGERIMTLPVGFRPVLQQIFMVPFADTASGIGSIRIDVHKDGQILVLAANTGLGAGVGYLALSGTQFLAA